MAGFMVGLLVPQSRRIRVGRWGRKESGRPDAMCVFRSRYPSLFAAGTGVRKGDGGLAEVYGWDCREVSEGRGKVRSMVTALSARVGD